MNHTPGPWHIQKYSSGHMLFVNADNAQIAHVLHTETHGLVDTAEKREANARLIAAAPELLTVCSHLLSACDGQVFNGGVTGEVLTVMEETRTVIVKLMSAD